MAALQHRNGSYRVIFRYHGKQHAFTIGEVTDQEAEAKVAQVDYLLLRLRQRLATIPAGVCIVDYVQFDGKTEQVVPQTEKITLKDLKDRYLETHKKSLELSTVKGIKQHFGFLIGHLGENFPIAELVMANLQGYVDKRAKARGRNGRKLSAATIFKELVTLRTAWNWGIEMKFVAGKFPLRGLTLPKTTEKPRFMTRAEIERQIRLNKLSKAEIADLWEALYLMIPQIKEVLEHIKRQPVQPFVYPMVCFIAYTGCRRSEALRAKITDIDFEARTVIIHERKRVRGVITTRQVPLSDTLATVLKEWFAIHPGGEYLFCQSRDVIRSKTSTGIVRAITKDEAADHFDRAVGKGIAGSRWGILKGFHVFRHSFISALANKNIDQRIIDDLVGHQSEEQRRRYRHLYPSTKNKVMKAVFG